MYRGLGAGTVALVLAAFVPACSPNSFDGSGGSVDPGAVTGKFVTYVADNRDGTTEWWHAIRTADGQEIRLDFDTPPLTASGAQVSIQGDMIGERLHVTSLQELTPIQIAAAGEPPTYESPLSPDTYGLVLVDLGSGVNMTAAQAMTILNGTGATDKSFAEYYSASSYGKYQVSGSILGPYQFSMTTCDTTGMYKAIEPMITGTVPNHLIYYFNETSLCTFGGLGEEGSAMQPAKRTWMNGSLSCVVLMQEPGHNIGLMHANTMKCGTNSFDTAPATDCTITEYGSSMSTMGGGCREFNAYERWYEGWLTGCNGVKTTGGGTFNLVPLETSCTDGSAAQVLQVPFPAQLVVSDPQSTSTAVDLNNFYVELRTASGMFDAYSSGGRGGGSGVTFTAPTLFIYASDNVKMPTTTTGRNGTMTTRQSSSVWTELLNMSPSASAFAGLTTAGQSFTDPNSGGATITLNSISATGASVTVTYPGGGTATPTCIDGTTLAAPGPATCGGSTSSGTGGTTGTGGATGTGGTTTTGTGGAKGGSTGSGGTTTTTGTGGAKGGSTGSGGSSSGGSGSGGSGSGGSGSGGSGSGGTTATGTGGTGISIGSGGANGTGGNNGTGGDVIVTGAGGTNGSGGDGPNDKTTLTGGCSCSFDPAHPAGSSRELWLAVTSVIGLAFARRPRKRV